MRHFNDFGRGLRGFQDSGDFERWVCVWIFWGAWTEAGSFVVFLVRWKAFEVFEHVSGVLVGSSGVGGWWVVRDMF